MLSIWEIYSLQIEPLQLRVTVKDNIRNNLKDRAFCSLQQVLISLGTLCLQMKIKRFSEILKTINEVGCWKCYSAEWSLFRKQKYSLIALGVIRGFRVLSVSLNNMNTLGTASPHWLHRKLPHKYTSNFLAKPVGNVHLTLVFTFKHLPSIVSNF